MLNRAQLAAARRRVTPGAQAVTLRARAAGAAADTFTDYPVAFAKRYPDTGDYAESDGLVADATYCRWQLWQADLTAAGAPAPRPDDLIAGADGVTWLIRSVNRKLLEQVFDCQAQQTPGQ